jgi:hypothetical protein
MGRLFAATFGALAHATETFATLTSIATKFGVSAITCNVIEGTT